MVSAPEGRLDKAPGEAAEPGGLLDPGFPKRHPGLYPDARSAGSNQPTKQRNPPGRSARGVLRFAAAPTGSPSAAVRTAAPVRHYSRDHLLLTSATPPAIGPTVSTAGRL